MSVNCSGWLSCCWMFQYSSSPVRTKSIAAISKAFTSCAMCATVHTAGRLRVPSSGPIEPKSAANRVDFPAPLTPVRPTFQPGWICMEAFWNNTRPPRRNETWSSWIMELSNIRKRCAYSNGCVSKRLNIQNLSELKSWIAAFQGRMKSFDLWSES